jgi:hypothetical protein
MTTIEAPTSALRARFGVPTEACTRLFDDVEDLAVSRLHERHKFLIVRLKIFITEDSGCRGFKRGEIGRRQFQDERVVGTREIGQETERALYSGALLNGESFLHHREGFTGFSELQPKDVADENHEQLLLCGQDDESRLQAFS